MNPPRSPGSAQPATSSGNIKAFNLLTASLCLLFCISCSKDSAPARNANTAKNQAPSEAVPVTPRAVEFPRDEGAHYEQPIEWWYMSSHLKDEKGKEYGFFFCALSTGRHLVSLYDKAADKMITKDYYESLNASQDFHSVSSPSLKWKQAGAPFTYTFAYDFEGLTVQLDIKSNRKPFLPAGTGFIKMGVSGTSHYYALTDLTLQGTINTGGGASPVRGSGWLDHQWGKWDWVEDFSQWKWFGVKLDNGIDLMLFNFYKDKKLIASYCGYIDPEGNQAHKLSNELITRSYFEDASGGKWQKVVDIKINSLPDTVLTLTSERDDQFVEPQVLWEGSMKVKGTFKGTPVTGVAYGELNRPD